jgi:hypothetical protein
MALSGIFGGIFFAGAMCSFAIGVVLLPLTLVGLFFLIGLLGLIPFVTAFVYLRNAIRALRRGNSHESRANPIGAAVLSGFMVIGISAFAQWGVHEIVRQSMNEVLSHQPASFDSAVRKMKRLSWLVDTDDIVDAYQKEADASRREELGKAYKAITGVSIESRISDLQD